MKYLLIIFIFLLSKLFAQHNYVPNNSFEEIDSCYPPINSPALLKNWTLGNNGTTDLWITNGCPPWGGSPVNPAGFQYAKTGINYIGIISTFYGSPANYREYIQTRLCTTLEPNKKYLVGFWCSLAEGMCLKASSKLGAWLSDTVADPSVYGYTYIPETPQILNDSANVLKDTSNAWMLVMDTLTAVGNEKYITIGNFFDDAHAGTTLTGINYPTPDSTSYYYIDDVFIYCLDGTCDTSWVGMSEEKNRLDEDVKIFPNPFNFQINFSFNSDDKYQIRIFDVQGKELKSVIFSGMNHSLDFSGFSEGIYFVEVSNSSRGMFRKKIIKE